MPHVIIYILSTSIFENTTMTSSLLKLFLYFSSVSSGAPPLPHPHPRTKCKSKVRTKAWSWCERGKFTEGKLPQIQTGWNCPQPAARTQFRYAGSAVAVRCTDPQPSHRDAAMFQDIGHGTRTGHTRGDGDSSSIRRPPRRLQDVEDPQKTEGTLHST